MCLIVLVIILYEYLYRSSKADTTVDDSDMIGLAAVLGSIVLVPAWLTGFSLFLADLVPESARWRAVSCAFITLDAPFAIQLFLTPNQTWYIGLLRALWPAHVALLVGAVTSWEKDVKTQALPISQENGSKARSNTANVGRGVLY